MKLKDWLVLTIGWQVIVVVIIMFVITNVFSQDMESEDKALSAMMVGVWKEKFDFPKTGKVYDGLSVYYPNKTFESRITVYQPNRAPINALVTGKWVVMGSDLICEAMESSSSFVWEKGLISVTLIMHIDNKKVFRRLDDGKMFTAYRVCFIPGADAVDVYKYFAGNPSTPPPPSPEQQEQQKAESSYKATARKYLAETGVTWDDVRH